MFKFQNNYLETNLWENKTLNKHLNLWENLDLFVILSSKENKIIELILNKIIDDSIENISWKDIYNKFSITLESVNFFIKTLLNNYEENLEIDMVIWLLENNNFHFSKIWSWSAYMINSKKEFLKISDENNKNSFWYISSWKLNDKEKIILSNSLLNNVLTQSDCEELWLLDDVEKINNSILNILKDDNFEENTIIYSIEYIFDSIEKKSILWEKTKNILYKYLDNNLSKKALAYYMLIREKIEQRWKILKNIIFISWILLSSFLLFSIISNIIWTTTTTKNETESKTDLIEARDFIRVANQNIATPEIFDLNIKKAEELISKVKEQKIYLNDIEEIENDISIIKKQFNQIEIFESNSNNLIFKWDFVDPVRMIELNKKIYVLSKTSLYWPIISWQSIKNNTFKELEVDDEFIDGTSDWDSIIIITKKSRVVKFNKNWSFKYINVIWQKIWEKSSFIDSYNWNIYLTDDTQIYKHSSSTDSYTSWVSYLKEEDKKDIWKIISMWIDWGIYILNNELKLFKLFTAPKYRLQTITLNKLPKNYNLEDKNVKLITRVNLNYVYIFLNNKIWIFEPNTKVFTDTKNLNYRWQIEWKSEKIRWFYVEKDWIIQVLTESWIYKLNFEIKDDKLIIR